MAANTERQADAARALNIPPAPFYEVTRFEVAQVGTHLSVTREYSRNDRGYYWEHYSIGPRGGSTMGASGFCLGRSPA